MSKHLGNFTGNIKELRQIGAALHLFIIGVIFASID